MNEGKLSVRVELENRYVEMINELKTSRPIESNSEAIRHALYVATREHGFSLDERQLTEIKRLLAFKHVKSGYAVYSVPEFVNQAINSFIATIRETMPSIQNWDVRAELKDDELEIALAIIEGQKEVISEEVSVDNIADKLNKRNTDKIQEILDDFVSSGILETVLRDGKILYHARK